MSITGKLELIYPRLPILAQNVMISGQGALFRRQRYGPDFHRALAEAKERAAWSGDRLAAWQLGTLRAFLIHADRTSPYWRRRFAEREFDPARLETLEDLRRVPVMEKSDLRTRAREIASEVVSFNKLIPAHTSGTTGAPIAVGYTRYDMSTRMAYLARMFESFGVGPLSRSVRFSGRTLFPSAAKNGVFWRYNQPMAQMLMSSYDLHERHMQAYIDQLARYRPLVIDGYPSAIYILARFINGAGQSGRVTPRAVMTTAETLEPYQREEIREAFGGCAVINQYASSEGAPFITEDPQGELVVNTDTGVFEFVRPGSDEPAQPGELAEMLVTSFTTHAYPLIRYRIGDTALLPSVPRRSRVWDMPVVEGVLGRQEDILYTPERGYISSLNKVFAEAPNTITESQIVQRGPTDFLLRVVPRGAEFGVQDLDGAIRELRKRVGQVEVSVEVMDRLPRGANGKLRAVIGMSDHRQTVP